MTGPVLPTAEEEFMQSMARFLDNAVNIDTPDGAERVGFAFLVFTPGRIGGSHTNWVSNVERPTVLAAMKELIERFEAKERAEGRKDWRQ